ncbi:MAG: ABC transporter substrate-binding protein [Acidobacteria bacterium]|nr:ABC transporter substrate-binding protein [Acidobacteriota bacterium]
MHRRRFLAAPLLLAGCSKTDSARPAVKIAVGGQSQLVYLPATLAQQLHHYQQEGLDVSLIDFPGGSKALEALLGGSVDVVCGFFDHIIQLNAEGRSLRSFVTMLRYPGLALVVSPATNRKIEAVADLNGAVVGVSAPGSSTDLFLRYLLRKHSVDPANVSFTGIGMSAGAVAAMERAKVDAAIMADPAIMMLARRTKSNLRILADTRTRTGVKEAFGVEQYPAAVLYSTTGWLEKNAATAAALARAMRKTLAHIQASPDAVAAAMPKEFQGDDPSLYAEAVAKALPMYSPDGRMPADGPAAVQRVLAVTLPKVRDAKLDLRATYTD